jgi:hypothetical protein
MAYTNPTVADFKAYFTRDFIYGTTSTTVNDSDISKALAQASFNFNEALFATQSGYTLCFLWLTAHYLCIDMQASSQGLSGKAQWLVNSHSVGNVSESYAIPQRILDSPEFTMYATTAYGVKFLSLIIPNLSGQIFSVEGATHP